MIPDYDLILKVIKGITQPLATLFAAFFGVLFAYLLQRKQKLSEIRKDNVAASNRAFFVLFQQLNTLALVQKDFLDPMRGRPEAFIAMQPILPDDHAEMSYDFSSLEFLLSTKHKQLLLDLWLEQQRFREAIRVLNYRSNLHFSEVQPKLIAAGIKENIEYPNTVFKEALGTLLYTNLQRITEQVFLHVDRTVTSLDNLKTRLNDGLKDLFPEADFLKIELLAEEANKPLKPIAAQEAAPT